MKLKDRIKRKIAEYSMSMLRAVISIHKRDYTLIVYGGALDLFIDNAKHLFIINNNTMPSYHHVWLTRSVKTYNRIKKLGYEVFLSDSEEGRKMQYKAGMVIYDYRIDEFASHERLSGAIKFELWHGIPGKRIGLIKTDPPQPYVIGNSFKYKYFYKHTYGDYVLSTSKKVSIALSAAFQIPLENVIISDQPRNHCFYMTEEELDTFVERFEDDKCIQLYKELKNDDKLKVLYMPTFRDADANFIYKAIPNWDDFNDFLGEHNIILYLKVHRMTPLPQDLSFKNIKIINNELDIYPLLPMFDRLISDYSSIIYDYALLKKPIIIYDFDLDEFINNSRRINSDFLLLLKNSSYAHSFKDLRTLLISPSSCIKPILVDNYYECPGDLLSIYSFINTIIKKQSINN